MAMLYNPRCSAATTYQPSPLVYRTRETRALVPANQQLLICPDNGGARYTPFALPQTPIVRSANMQAVPRRGLPMCCKKENPAPYVESSCDGKRRARGSTNSSSSGGLDLLVGVATLAEPQSVNSRGVPLERPKKKRGRRPTPGLTEEQRRQHRMMKNRKTAEKSRQRRLDHARSLRMEVDELKEENSRLRDMVNALCKRLGEEPVLIDSISVEQDLCAEEKLSSDSQPCSPVSTDK